MLCIPFRDDEVEDVQPPGIIWAEFFHLVSCCPTLFITL